MNNPGRLAAFAAAAFLSGGLQAAPTSDPAVLSGNLFPEVKSGFATPGYRNKTFTQYDQVKDHLLAAIAGRSDARLYSLMKTDQGREMWAVELGNPKPKVRVMIYARVHGDEPAASEGALALLDSLTHGELEGQHGDVQIVIVPMANPDGAVAGKRTTARGGDINRDFVKYDWAETRAIQGEILRFDPHVVIDAHEFTVWGRLGDRSSASDMQSAGPNEPNLPKSLIDAHEKLFRTAISRNFSEFGLRHELYELLSTDKQSGRLQVAESATTFVSAKNFQAMTGRISLLFETRGIGLGEQNITRRAAAHYQGMKAVVQTAQANADALARLLENARKEIIQRLSWEVDRRPIREEREFLLADGASGKLVGVPADFVNRTSGTATATVAVPRYYLLPQSAKASVDILTHMGIDVQQLRKPITATVGVQTASFAPRGEGFVVDSRTVEAPRDFAAGDYVVDTRQRAGLLLQVLEGASPNGFARAGLLGKQGTIELPFYRYDSEF